MKKAFTRRFQPDRSQVLRRFMQYVFVALNVWIGVEFFFFVRQFERGGYAHFERPPGVEGWLPIAGLLNLSIFWRQVVCRRFIRLRWFYWLHFF